MVTAAAFAAAIGAACGNDSPTSNSHTGKPTDTVAGNFTLSKVNAAALPVAIFSDPGNYTLEITAGTFVLQTTGQYVASTTSRETVAGHASIYVDTTRGTWTQLAGAITLVQGSSTVVGAWDGNTLTLVQDSVTYAYKKQ